MPNLHDKTYPGETPEYRSARNELLIAEIALRRQTEAVAQMRRELPQGGKVGTDYIFDEYVNGELKKTRMSELFGPGKDTLAIYSMMYAPADEKACPSCTSIVDGLDGSSPHIMDRINFVVVTKAPIEKLLAWAKYRGWHNVCLLSSFSNTYNSDYFAENLKGGQMPALNVFQNTPDGIFHFYGTELLYAPSDPGQNARHVDTIWPVWNMFDLTPEGRGQNWYPKFEYA
jgi:predicted dithiol-disulfide oxidoreductase (DUF899 family)